MNDLKALFSDEGIQRIVSRNPKFKGRLNLIKELWETYKKILQLNEKINSEIKFTYKKQDIDLQNEKLLKNNKKKKKILNEITVFLKKIVFNHISFIPNLPSEGSPIGADASKNQIVYESSFSKTPKTKSHLELGTRLRLLDFMTPVQMSKSGFAGFLQEGTRILRILKNLFLDSNKKHGFEEIMLPFLVNENALFGTGQFPKFRDDVFKIENENLFLIPTSEVTLINFFAKKTFNEKDLPKKFTSFSPCFRREGGSAGTETTGLIRLHQFFKVEIVAFVRPEDAEKMFQKMIEASSSLLKMLKIPYRIVNLCRGDLGFAAAQTYDIEAWLPSQQRYVEVVSISNTKSFQARRLNIKYRNDSKSKKDFVVTLNGSSLPLGRIFAILIEQYYDSKSDSIKWPEAILKYEKSPLDFFNE